MKLTKYWFLIISTLLLIILIVISSLERPSWLVEFKRGYNASLLEPLEVFGITALVASLLMLSQETKKIVVWIKYILSWFLPLSFLVVASGTDGAQFGWMPKTSLAQIMGGLFVIVTIVFILIQMLLIKLQKIEFDSCE